APASVCLAPSGGILPRRTVEPFTGSLGWFAVEKISKLLLFSDAAVAECPSCTAAVPFRRSVGPVIDSSGVETDTLVCPACGHSFSGIIDPADDAFLAHDVQR